MIRLNLLPPQKKEEIKWEKVNHILVINEAVVVAELIVFIAVLLLTQIYLSSELSRVDKLVAQKQQEAEIKEVEKLKNEVRIFNRRLNLAGEVQDQQISWTKILNELSLITPETVQITNLNIKRISLSNSGNKRSKNTNIDVGDGNGKKCHFSLTGYAKTRENLLEFENNLKNSDYFTDLKSNRSNYLEPRNVNFRYEFNLSEEMLR